jgi:hypothetical protein
LRKQRVAAAPEGRVAGGRPCWEGLFKILAFFLTIGVLALILDRGITFGLKRIRVSKFGALNRIMSGQVNADIIISGSSRALSHYDPRVIQSAMGESAYNIGMNASQMDFELAVFKAYLAHNQKRPKLVIQNLDLFSFETTKKGQLYDPGYYMPYLRDPDLYNFIRRVQPDAWKCRYLPLYGYVVDDMRFTWIWGLLGCVGIQGREDYYLGFNPRAATWNDDFQHFKASNTTGVSYGIEPEGVNSLAELIQLCQRNGIRVILVYSPEYYEMQALETNRGQVIARFQQIAGQFNVPFWDYSDSAISMRREYFNNSQHLNAEGAELFSNELGQRLAGEHLQTVAQRGK